MVDPIRHEPATTRYTDRVAGIMRVFDEIGTPMTVRQMFYALTTRGYVPKTEQGYKQVGYRLLQMRRLQIIPVELDAIPANVLRRMVEECITRHINRAELERIARIEMQERETLAAVTSKLA